MKIGIDLDGVVIDSETTFRTYEEIFDIDILKGNNLINKKEPKFQARYNWTNEQEKELFDKVKACYDEIIQITECQTFIKGFKLGARFFIECFENDADIFDE